MQKTNFDRTNAINKAMNVFWQRGYENTSLKDLLLEMDILNGSFYNTFGSKQSIFLEALNMYIESVLKDRIAKFKEQPTFKKGLKQFLTLAAMDCMNTKHPKVCMVANSLQLEMLKPGKIRNEIEDKLEIYRSFLHQEIAKAQKEDQVTKRISPKHLSCLIVTFSQGLVKSALIAESEKQIEKQIETFLVLICDEKNTKK